MLWVERVNLDHRHEISHVVQALPHANQNGHVWDSRAEWCMSQSFDGATTLSCCVRQKKKNFCWKRG